MQRYSLAPHVYLCVTDDHVVLLDLRRDKYMGVSREHMAAFAEWVRGWPTADGHTLTQVLPANVRTSKERAEAVLDRMLAAGMLTTDPSCGKDARPVEMPRAEHALVEEDLETRPAIAPRDVLRFLWASAVTALLLKLRPIEAVIAGLARRKARAAGVPLDLDRARRAVAAFIRLRPLLFGAQDACLFDSLALLCFLSYEGLFPTCVIGVHTGPFSAHCWVQHAALVFNDAPEYVRRFTPILAV